MNSPDSHSRDPGATMEITEDYTSGPVDVQNPTFGSLLSALKAFHEGDEELETLKTYHRVLSRQLKESRQNIREMEIHEGTEDTRNLSLGALLLLDETLARLGEYIEAPGPETLGLCVESLLNSRGAVTFVGRMLDANIAAAGIEG